VCSVSSCNMIFYLNSASVNSAAIASVIHSDVRAVTLCDSEAHLTHRVLSLLNTFLRF
jgi:hypothetical protein